MVIISLLQPVLHVIPLFPLILLDIRAFFPFHIQYFGSFSFSNYMAGAILNVLDILYYITTVIFT